MIAQIRPHLGQMLMHFTSIWPTLRGENYIKGPSACTGLILSDIFKQLGSHESPELPLSIGAW